MPLTPGQQLGSYEILSSLGAGGMGEVYRAKDKRLGRDVALKILPPDVTSEPGRLERFDREARAIAALNHPHIVTIYSTEHVDDVRFLTMELVDGCTLHDLVLSSGMTIPRFLEIAIPLADALAAAHQKQIMHRDLKPGNVMVSSEGRVKVLDFGLARVGGVDAGEETVLATQAPITKQGVIVGTMPYMSPEQVEGRFLDARSDLFSLGVIFYELLNGDRPFKGSSSPALMSAILRDTPGSLADKRSDIPDALDRLISRLLEKRPEDRVQTARDVFNELRHIQKQIDSGRARPSSSSKGMPDSSANMWVAVLPYSVRSTDADAEAIAAGLTDDIAAGLARFPGLSVVAPQSTRAFRDSPLDVRTIADRLNARYVITGNVRKSGGTIRVVAQLVDAQTGTQLWTETYDRKTSDGHDVFAIQDDVTDHIVATIGDQSGILARSMVRELQRQVSIGESSAGQLILQAWGFLHEPGPSGHAELRAALEAQLAVTPDDASLWAILASVYVCEHSLFFNPLPDSLGRAQRAARRAIAIDHANQNGWLWLGITAFHLHDRAGFNEGTERAIRINPRNAHTVAWTGNMLTHAGEYERGSQLTDRAMQINPGHPGWLHFAAFNRNFAAGEFERSLQAARRVNVPSFFWMHFAICAAAGQAGLTSVGRAAYEEAVRLQPAFADPENLREFVTRWYWEEAMIEGLITGVLRSFDGGSTGVLRPSDRSTSGERSSNVRPNDHERALSVAVLPFVARSSDDESKALADGLTEDITSGLSHFGYLRVLPRSLADRLARERGSMHTQARFAIEGSIRKAGATMRINLTLVNTETNTNLWTETFDRDAAKGTFSIQDDVASRVAATIGDQTGVLVKAMGESISRRPIEQLSVSELVIRYHLYAEVVRADEHLLLRSAFERALEKEPRHAEGWACLARLIQQEHGLGFNPLPDIQGRQRHAADRAIEIDSRSQEAWIALASVHEFARDRQALSSSVERAVSLNPLNADLVARGALFLSLAGEHERAETLLQSAIALKPQHPGWYHLTRSNTALARADYETALAEIKGVAMPMMPMVNYATAAAAGHLGRVSESKAAMAALREIDPKLVDPQLARTYWTAWLWDDESIDRMVDGFNRATELARSDVRSGDRQRPPSSTSGAAIGNELSITVLPLVARSSDEESKALAEGLSDDIAAGLSRFGHLRVRSRSASRALARYSLEGYVRKAGPSIRVSVTIVDTDTGANLWAEQYDRNAATAAFELQDDIASRVVAAVGDQTGVLARSMAAAIAGKPIEQLSVAELVVRFHIYTENFRPDEHARLREAFERALEHEPRNAEGWGCLAMLYEQEHGFNFNRLPGTLIRHRQAAERAIELDPRCQQAWIALVTVHVFARDIEGLKTSVERAVSINPLNADQLAVAGLFLSMAGEYERARELVATATARKPQHPGWYHFAMCNYHVARGDYEAALREIKSVNMPKMPLMHLFAAAISGHLGRATEAKAAFEGLRNINPSLTETENARGVWAVWIWNEDFLRGLEEGFVKARRLAGLSPPPSQAPASGISSEQSIAVLPFVDLSETKDQDWFCDGIAEELLNALAPLPGLRVAARASAFSLRGKTDDLRSIGDKLNVTTVLEGSVRRLGDRVRITTRLSDTKEGRQLWSERFDRELKDIFDVQEEIARAIVERLRVTIAGGSARLVQQTTTNMEAYELLLKGRAFVTRRGRAVLEAIPLFERAIALDSNLAEAHALLGDAYRLLGLYGIARASEVMPKARASIDRALAIDPNQPEALASWAISASIYEWDIDQVRKRSDRAIAADPSHVRARAERAISLACLYTSGTSWHGEVLAEAERARTLDPLNAWVAAIQGFVQYLVGRSDEGIANARRAIELDPGNFTAHWVHVSALAHAGRDDEALAAAEPALAMSGRHPMILATIAAIYSDRDEQQKAEAIRAELAERATSTFIGSGARACVAASAGHWLEARDFTRIAADEHDPFMAFWKLRAWRLVWKDEQCAAIIRGTSLFQGADG